MNIQDIVKEVLSRLSTPESPAYLVGGTVRDILRGKDPVDTDIVCASGKETIVRELQQLYPKAIGINTKGTIEVRGKIGGNDSIIQVSTMQGKTITEDLKRRDFTINAMAMTINGDITDPFGGSEDVKNMVIQAVDNDACFVDSPIRILRAFRFMSAFGYTLSYGTSRSIMDHASLVHLCPAEMVCNEMTRILMGVTVGLTLNRMKMLNIFDRVFPEFTMAELVKQSPPWHDKTVWDHTVAAVCHIPAEPLLKWAALLHDVGKPSCASVGEDGKNHFYKHDLAGSAMTENICTRLRMPNSVTDTLVTLVANHMRINRYEDNWSDASVLRVDRELGDNVTDMLYELALADVSAGGKIAVDESRKRLYSFKDRLTVLRSKRGEVKAMLPKGIGERIMKVLGIGPGKEVGDIKAYLEEEIKSGRLEEGLNIEYYDQSIKQAKSDLCKTNSLK